MKQQSLASRLNLSRPIPLSHIVEQIASRAQTNTQHYGRRPYGVGLLIAGVDASGCHLYEFNPSGVTTEMSADAIGARSQMARTYLERHLEKFADCGRDELTMHALRALRESLQQDKELTIDNTSIGVGGKGERFVLCEGEKIRSWLDKAMESGGGREGEEQTTMEGGQQGEGAEGGERMDVDT